METTEDLAYYAKQPRRRHGRGLCFIHEDRLIAVEDQNEFLVQATQDLQDENDELKRQLAQAERDKEMLLVRNTELYFLNAKLLVQKNAMRNALKGVYKAHALFQEAAGENLGSVSLDDNKKPNDNDKENNIPDEVTVWHENKNIGY